MEQSHGLHIVDAERSVRTELARMASDLGHRAEVYKGWDEFARRSPQAGIVLARDMTSPGAHANDAIAALARAGSSLPLILVAEQPTTARVVEGIKQGALDFLDLPCAADRLAGALARVKAETAARVRGRFRTTAARERLAALSRRERQVLDQLAEGCSNKEIARVLGISPRTVEIHRGNMMAKLGANHAADAVRVWIDARFDEDD